MGLLMRPRRPIARMAAGAATAGVAYHAGKERARAETDQQQNVAPAGYAPAAGSPPAPTGGPVAGGPADELTRLAQLHDQGALTDEEFAAAKRRAIEG